MKIKHILATLILLAAVQFTVSAQLVLGPGIGYGTEIEDNGIAIQARGIYTISGPWRAGADFNYYLDGIEDYSVWDFNVNGHYLFLEGDGLQAYALAGLNYIKFKVKTGIPGFDGSASDTGLNIGGGIQLPFGGITGLAEVRYVLGDANQLVLSACILFPIGGK
ncbi:MAG: outer membrane beta-barrel protein [Lewinellaceae bacterium]|jgi:opacity protein-like surface antigen|nr:outer membrane beta-barrel protein [Lewinellaceae bacterium]